MARRRRWSVSGNVTVDLCDLRLRMIYVLGMECSDRGYPMLFLVHGQHSASTLWPAGHNTCQGESIRCKQIWYDLRDRKSSPQTATEHSVCFFFRLSLLSLFAFEFRNTCDARGMEGGSLLWPKAEVAADSKTSQRETPSELFIDCFRVRDRTKEVVSQSHVVLVCE